MSDFAPEVSAELVDGLNDAQVEAVVHGDGPMLVVAGAGSGKTRVLTHRIAHLIDGGISPFEILAITFTNKAAEEMRNRIATLVGPVALRMWVSTFHSACVRILRADAVRLGFPSSFVIYDTADARRLMGYVLRDLDIDPKRLSPRNVLAQVSLAKNRLQTPEDLADAARHVMERRIADAYAEYQARLLKSGAMDFDDLLAQTVRLFRTFPDVLERYQQRFRHVLIDEYQDTNHVQNELVILLAAKHRNVFVVGDGDQSIYQFRGADMSNILQFESAFPDASTVVLDQNYRSTQTILDAANAVISNNMSRRPKDLWTDAGAGHPIRRYCGDDENDEAQWIAHEIGRLVNEDDAAHGDIAVFYRTNSQSRVLEENLFRAGVPYRVIGGTKFYDRKEVKDALAYVRTVVNPADEVSVKRIINQPKRGIGDASISKLDGYAAEHDITFYDTLRDAPEAGVTGPAVRGLDGFVALIESAQAVVEQGPRPLLEMLLSDSGYIDELRSEHTIEAEGRIENLQELLGHAAEFDTVEEFLEQVALVADGDPSPGDETDETTASSGEVVLMTVHGAKGLEFPIVFLTGMEEGVFPHVRTMTEPEQIEEERRLAYVAMTRAMQRLYITHAFSRMFNGASNYNPLSRFVNEVPDELVSEVEGSRSAGGAWGNEPPSWSEWESDSSLRRRRSRVERGGSGGEFTPGEPTPYGRVRTTLRRESTVDPNQRALGIPGVSRGFGAAASRREGNVLADPSAAAPAPVPTFRVGEDVVHAVWGEGVVMDVSGSGERAEATVRFRDVGEKRLMLGVAPLARADGAKPPAGDEGEHR